MAIALPIFVFAKTNKIERKCTTNNRVWTVDNNPSAQANYTTIDAAISAATNGDTILIQPSPQNYDGFTLNKKLVIYSRGAHGHLVDKDKNVTVGSSSVNADASGSTIEGLYFRYGSRLNFSIYSQTIEDIKIINNFFYFSYIEMNCVYGIIRNNIIEGNTFWLGSGGHCIYMGHNHVSKTSYNTIKNNYFMVHAQNANSYAGRNLSIIRDANSTNLFSNNLIVESVVSGGSFSDNGTPFFRGCGMEIQNNIIWSNVANRARFDTLDASATYTNNITYSATNKPANLPGTNFNDTMPVFETSFSNSSPPQYQLNYNYKLKSTSIGKNAGTDSTDIGLFGAGYIFDILSRSNSTPIIEDFRIINPIIKQGGTLKVKIKARKPEQ